MEVAATDGPTTALAVALSGEVVPDLVALRYQEPERYKSLLVALHAAGISRVDTTALRRATRQRGDQPHLRSVQPGESPLPTPLPAVRDKVVVSGGRRGPVPDGIRYVQTASTTSR